MLKQITIENLFNFKDSLTLDFTSQEAKTAYRIHDEYISNIALLYGKNNVGKSNYLRLLYEIAKFVNKDEFHLERYKPHTKQESSFEMILANKETEIRYGFTLNLDNNLIDDEWLFYKSLEDSEEQVFFDRKEQFLQEDIISIDDLKTSELLIQKQLKHEYLKTVSEFFASITMLDESVAVSSAEKIDLYETLHAFSTEKRDLINLFLRVSDLEINKFVLKNHDVEFVHKSSELFGFSELSSGTQNLFLKVKNLVSLMDQTHFILIDEIEKGLHPDLCNLLMSFLRYLVTCNPELQVLITTHQENLLDLDYISNENKMFLDFDDAKDTISIKYLSEYHLNPLQQVSQRYRLNAFGVNPKLTQEYDLMSYFLNRDDHEA